MEATIPFNGSGTFARLYSWVVDAANNIDILSTKMDAEMNGFAAGLSNCVTRDGQSPPSADLPMGGKKLVNLGNAIVSTDALNMATGDGRYILLTATSLTLSGALTAGSLTTGGALAVTGTSTLGIVNASGLLTLTGGTNYGASHSRAGQVGYHFYNQGGVAEWVAYQPIHATGDEYRIASVAGGIFTDRLLISPSGAVTIVGSLTANSLTLTTPLAVASGGTGVTSSTGTGSIVFSASPALTGTPTAPTAAVGTSTTQLATTAFVQAARPPIGQSIASAATVTPTFNDDFVEITAQAVGLTLANPTGTAANMWGIAIRIKDNATPQTIAFGTQYRGVGVTLPTTTVAGKTTVLGMLFNSALTKWDVVSVAQE